MSAVKLVGAAAVLVSCALLGQYYAMRGKALAEELYEFRRALGVLRAEMEFALNPLAVACQNVSGRSRGGTAAFFRQFAASLESRDATVSEAWQSAALPAVFEGEDRDALSALAQTLGYLDKQMQSAGIAMAERYIDEKTGRLMEKHRRDSRVYGTAGLVCGLIPAIVLI